MPPFRDKYFLKDVHEQIGLLDRKIAHLMKYETFATDTKREEAAAKLTTKRNQLARSAQEMVESGIEYKPSDIPVSLRSIAEQESGSVPQTLDEMPLSQMPEAVYAGSALDYRNGLEEYMQKKRKSA